MSINPVIFNPVPEDTETIAIPEEILGYVEEMAENAHEVWADMRMKQGWTYGPKEDEEKKEHPCLVPYSQLPESQKDYDRKTAIETLKLIKKMGYDIKKN